MIRYLYDMPYEWNKFLTLSNPNYLLPHVNAFILADKYDIPFFRQLIIGHFEDAMSLCWQSGRYAYSIETMKALCGAGCLADGTMKNTALVFCKAKTATCVPEERKVACLDAIFTM